VLVLLLPQLKEVLPQRKEFLHKLLLPNLLLVLNLLLRYMSIYFQKTFIS